MDNPMNVSYFIEWNTLNRAELAGQENENREA